MLIAASSIVPAAGTTDYLAPVLTPGYLICEGGTITEVGVGPPPGRPDVELTTGFLLPGLVDLQVNGYFGVELGDAEPVGWAEVVRRLPETGATAFLPTFITSPVDQLVAALRATAGFAPELAGPAAAGQAAAGIAPAPVSAGARVLGVHLEGPFIAASRRGAHNPAWIIPPDEKTIGALLAAGSGLVRVVTLAPEIDGAMAAIEQLTTAGALVSVGHSDATARQVAAAATAGAGRIFLVTDAAASAGMAAGRYVLGGEPIDLANGDGAPPVRADGTLAGSALRMDAAVANMVAAGIGLPEAVAAATRIPADLVGRPDLGRIAPGAAADLTWLADDLRTAATWVAGHQVYGCPLG